MSEAVGDTEFSHSYTTNNFWFAWDNARNDSRNVLTFYNSGEVTYQNNNNIIWANNSAVISTATFASASNGTIQAQGSSIVKIGQLVVLNLYVENVPTASGEISIAIIPTGFRPSKNVAFSVGYTANQSSSAVRYGIIYNTGTVRVAGVKDTVMLSTSYIVN